MNRIAFAGILMSLPCLLAAAPAAPRPQPAAAAMTEPRVFERDGAKLLYRWHAPAKLEAGRRYPLVILFHGAGERGDDNVAQLVHGATELLNYAKKTGEEVFFIAGQVPRNQQWVDTPWAQKYHSMSVEPSASMKLALALVDDVRANLPVDPARIYATGISMGGYGTWDAVQRRPGLFAAALPICGGGDTACAMRIRDVPIWCFHGDADGAVPVCRSRNMVAALWAVDGKIRYREYPGVGHNCWARTYGDDAVLAWLFSQRKGK